MKNKESATSTFRAALENFDNKQKILASKNAHFNNCKTTIEELSKVLEDREDKKRYQYLVETLKLQLATPTEGTALHELVQLYRSKNSLQDFLQDVKAAIPEIEKRHQAIQKEALEKDVEALTQLGIEAARELSPGVYEKGIKIFADKHNVDKGAMAKLVAKEILTPLGIPSEYSGELAVQINEVLEKRHNRPPKEGIAGIVDAIRQFIDDWCSTTLTLSNSKSARKDTSEKIASHVENVIKARYAPADSQDKWR